LAWRASSEGTRDEGGTVRLGETGDETLLNSTHPLLGMYVRIVEVIVRFWAEV
jgi:hypothetical protein